MCFPKRFPLNTLHHSSFLVPTLGRVAPAGLPTEALAGSGQGDFHHPALPDQPAHGGSPQIGTPIRGRGRGYDRIRSVNLAHVSRVRWLRRRSHLYHACAAWYARQAMLRRFPLTPK